MANEYTNDINIKNTILLRNILAELPSYVKIVFRGIENRTSSRTRLGYARDIKTFYNFLCSECPQFRGRKPIDITLEDISALEAEDIEEYLEYLKYYEKDGKVYTNAERAIKRKLSALRVFYAYLYKNDRIKSNPAEKVDMPKIHDKAITRLDVNEVAEFLDNVESGNKLSKAQLKRHEKLKTRDLALLTLMLGTGIRVSECVGLDMKDVDFDNDRIKVVRKGGAESFVYFGDEVEEALSAYMEERKELNPKEGHENALFLSSVGKRLCVRSVELLVKKYASTVTTVKHITPHKLRSTYGTNLYQESKDIYLVADVLGHKDVNTTRRHYAEIVDENKRNARNIVHLRRD